MDLRVNLRLDGSSFNRGIELARNQVSRLSQHFGGSIKSQIGGLFTVGMFTYAVKKTAEYAGKLTDLNSRTDVSIESLQRFDRAAKENGTSLETLTTFWERLAAARNEALKNPSGNQAAAFGALGVTQSDLRTKGNEDITRIISTKFQGAVNVESLMAPLREVGGRGVGELVAMFRAGLDQMNADMSVMTTEQALQLDELDDRMSVLGQTISIALAPALTAVIDPIKQVIFFIARLGESFGAIGRLIAEAMGFFKSDASINETIQAIKNTHQTNVERMKELVAKQDASSATEAQSLKERAARRRDSRPRLDFEPFQGEKDSKSPKLKASNAASDSLIAVGNFLGQSRNGIEFIQRETNNLMREQIRISKEMLRLMGRTSDPFGTP